MLAREDLEEGCAGDGRGRDDGPAVGFAGGVAVGEGVREVWEESWVVNRLGRLAGGWIVFVEGPVLDVDDGLPRCAG